MYYLPSTVPAGNWGNGEPKKTLHRTHQEKKGEDSNQ